MKKLMLAAMMMGMVAVTPVMAHASETEDTAVEAAMTEADENIRNIHAAHLPVIGSYHNFNWGENMEEEMAYKGYSGMFYTIDELNMRLMVPDGLEQRPRTEEEAANNIAVVFADENDENTVKIRYDEIEGCSSLNDVAMMLYTSTEPKFQIGLDKINGLYAVVAASEDADTVLAIFGAGEDTFVQVICSPISNAEMFEQYQYVIASIQALEE